MGRMDELFTKQSNTARPKRRGTAPKPKRGHAVARPRLRVAGMSAPRGRPGAPGAPAVMRGPAMTVAPSRPSRAKLQGSALLHAHTLLNPCNGPTVVSNYPGAKGYVTRFTQEHLLGNGTTSTAGFITFAPSAMSISATGVTTAFAVSYGYGVSEATLGSTANLTAPGTGYLGSSASCYRVIGACLTIIPVGAALYRAAVMRKASTTLTALPYNTIVSGANVAVTNLTSSLPGYPVTESLGSDAGALELRWYPSPEEEQYQTYSGAIAQNPADLNAVSFAWTAGSVQTQFIARVTSVVEWLPSLGANSEGSGLVAPSGQNVVVPMAHVQSALTSAHPSWMFSTAKEALEIAREVAPYAKAAWEFAPMLATLL